MFMHVRECLCGGGVCCNRFRWKNAIGQIIKRCARWKENNRPETNETTPTIRQCDVACISVRLDGFWKLWVPHGWWSGGCDAVRGKRRKAQFSFGYSFKDEPRGSGAWRGVTVWAEQGMDGWKPTPENRGVRPPPCPVSGVPIVSGRDHYPLTTRWCDGRHRF